MHKKVLCALILTIFICSLAGCKPGGKGRVSSGSGSKSSSQSSSLDASDNSSAGSSSAQNGLSSAGQGVKTASSSKNSISNGGKSVVPSQTAYVKKPLTKTEYQVNPKVLPGTKSKELLNNPNRGFRLEVSLLVSTGTIVNNTKSAEQYLNEQLDYYKDDLPQLAQTYIYLTDYSSKDLDSKALDNIQKYLDLLRKKKVQSLFRVSYEFDENNNKVGPTTAVMLRHMQQLKPILEKNKDVVHCIQAGFIGLWGEWHHPFHPEVLNDQKTILGGIVDMAPAGKFVQVRMVAYKNALDANDTRRKMVGFHDDYLVGEDHAWSDALPGTPEFTQLIKECPYTINDGEMPWGTDTYYNNGVIDGTLVAQRLQEQHYTSMSLAHNYKEGSSFATYNMTRWKNETADESYLKTNKLNYAPGWLTDENGKPTTRSVFAYIRDYLGYYIQASNVKVNVSGKKVNASLDLKNYGFAAPLAMSNIEVVVTDQNSNIITSQKACDLVKLQPLTNNSISVSLDAPELYGGYKIGIRLINMQGTSAKLANDTEYVNGVNTLVSFE